MKRVFSTYKEVVSQFIDGISARTSNVDSTGKRKTFYGNTGIRDEAKCEDTYKSYLLWGNEIIRVKDGVLKIDNCGWNTPTTMSRINCIIGGMKLWDGMPSINTNGWSIMEKPYPLFVNADNGEFLTQKDADEHRSETDEYHRTKLLRATSSYAILQYLRGLSFPEKYTTKDIDKIVKKVSNLKRNFGVDYNHAIGAHESSQLKMVGIVQSVFDHCLSEPNKEQLSKAMFTLRLIDNG